MKVAYADPPYLGLANKFYGKIHAEAAEYDQIQTHQRLIERLNDEFDAWALSLHSPSLRLILPLCPDDVRIMAWTKPFCSFKPGMRIAYTWEPVIVRGGRKRTRNQETVRDHCAVSIALKKGFRGAKPEAFCFWIFEVLNLMPDDEFNDIFPGSGGVTRAWEKWKKCWSEQFILEAL